jgi:hypothetical protein
MICDSKCDPVKYDNPRRSAFLERKFHSIEQSEIEEFRWSELHSSGRDKTNATITTDIPWESFLNWPSFINRKEIYFLCYHLYSQCYRPVGQNTVIIIIKYKRRENALRFSILKISIFCLDVAESNIMAFLYFCTNMVDLGMKKTLKLSDQLIWSTSWIKS